MSAIPTPTSISDAEWKRIVTAALNQRLNGYSIPSFDAAPASPTAGFTYYDTTLGKVRTWDGLVWNNHF